MISRLCMSAGTAARALIPNTLQRLNSGVSNRSPLVSSTAQIFANVLFERSVPTVRQFCTSAALSGSQTNLKVARSVEFHFPSKDISKSTTGKNGSSKETPNSFPKLNLQERISFGEYREKCLPTFQQFCNEFIKQHPEDKDVFLVSADKTYVKFCCDSYKAKYPPQSLEEYKEKNLFTFQEYYDECSWMVKLPAKNPSDTKETVLARAYEAYVASSYNDYIASFGPRISPLIL